MALAEPVRTGTQTGGPPILYLLDLYLRHRTVSSSNTALVLHLE